MTVPALLKEAPEQITAALIAWALLKRPRLKKDRKQYQTHKKQLENSVWEYLASKGVRSKRRIVADPRKFLLGTHGTRYDLKTLFDELNEKHFQRGLQSYLRWGTPTSKTSYQSYGFDSSGTKFSLITIAGIYNHPNVPDFAIKGVLYHEMLHILIPPYKKNFRNVIHGAAFKKAERLNPYLDKWQTWEKKELHAIIRSPRKQKPKGKLWFF
jgi:hypothetical protein